MAEQLLNNASTSLNGGINNSTTTVVVNNGSVLPSSGNFRILIGSEIMLVTAISSNTLTVTRGAEGTTAVSHSSGDNVDHIYTKGSLEQIIQDYDQSGGYSSRPSSPRKGTIYTATDLQARWYYNGTNWDLIWPVYIANSKQWDVTPWTAQNQSTGTFTSKNGILEVTTLPGNNNNAVRGYSKSLPSTPYKATWIQSTHPLASQPFSLYIGHRESSSGKLKIMFNAANNGGIIGVESWSNYNSFSSVSLSAHQSYKGRFTWNRVENDGTNFNYYTSHDGKNYTKFFSETKSTGFTTNADQIFFGFMAGTQYYTSSDVGAQLLYGYWEE